MIATDAAFEVVNTFFFSSRYAERRLEPGICDFTFGNPHEMPVSFRCVYGKLKLGCSDGEALRGSGVNE
jgi:hypothetical protein